MSLVSGEYRNTVAMVSREAIRWNITQEKKRLSENTLLYAVVKADGYGHGAVEIAKTASDAGVDGFCVAILSEAVELREAGITKPILVMGLTDPVYADIAAKQGIALTFGHLEWIEKAETVLSEKNVQQILALHMALDTGMGRIGFRTEEEVQACEQKIHNSKHIYLEGVFTHFAKADSKDTTHFEGQQKRFNRLIESFAKRPEIIHTANSATTLFHPNQSSELIRFGIAMYGLNPSGNVLTPPFDLKPALELKTELIDVKQMHEGDTISYGATYCAKEGEWIGTLPIGYADGWLRGLQGQDVLVAGKRCEIVGRICMDQCMIRLPEQMPLGTEVVLIGQSGNDEITMQELADKLNTIHYEVTTTIASRVKRMYVN